MRKSATNSLLNKIDFDLKVWPENLRVDTSEFSTMEVDHFQKQHYMFSN